MTAEQLRAIMAFLQERVRVADADGTGTTAIAFQPPSAAEMEAAGLDEEGAGRIVGSEWFPEMVDEVVTTPAFCDPGDPPELVLRYARDVVSEYISKRFVP